MKTDANQVKDKPCQIPAALFDENDENYAEEYMRQAYCPNFYDHAMGDCCGANDIDFDEEDS